MKHAPRLILIPAAFSLLGCQSMRQHHPNYHAGPIPGSTATRTVPVWMSDGSLATFSDTLPITGVQAASEKGFKDDFECIPDHQVAIGTMTVPADKDGYEGEAEWVIRFPQPIISYRGASPEKLGRTRVTVMGLIEGKALSHLGNYCENRWAVACVGNNVLTDGPGHTMPLKELQSISKGKLMLQTEFLDVCSGKSLALPPGRQSWRTVDFEESKVRAVLESTKLLKWIDTLAAASDSAPELKRIRHLNLSALGNNCAAVNNTKYLYPAVVGAVLEMSLPWRWLHFRDNLTDHVRAGTVAGIENVNDCIPPAGGTIRLTFHRPGGADVASLRVVNSPQPTASE